MHQRTEKLRQIMASSGLTAQQVADLIDRKPNTVRVWRCDTSSSKVIPSHLLELLELKLARVDN